MRPFCLVWADQATIADIQEGELVAANSKTIRLRKKVLNPSFASGA